MSLIQMLNDCGGAKNYSAVFDGTRMLERTPVAATNRKKLSLSFWFKGNTGLSLFNNPVLAGYDLTGSTLTNSAKVFQDFGVSFPQGPGGLDYSDTVSSDIFNSNGSGSTPGGGSVWHHFLLAIDTTVGTEADRVKTYINNSLITVGRSVQCAVNLDSVLTLNELQMIGAMFTGGTVDYVTDIALARMQIAEMYLIDGQQLTPSSFITVASPIKAKKYTGTYGAQGFYLPFSDKSNMGKDFSGNGNDFSPHAGFTAPTRSSSNPFKPV